MRPRCSSCSQPLAAGLLLHGHLHRRVQRTIPTRAGRVLQVGATSASLHHDDADRMAGFNVYDARRTAPRLASRRTSTRRMNGTFHVESVPKSV